MSQGNKTLINNLISLNPGINGNALTVGSTICIPPCHISSYDLNSNCVWYTVRVNDTLNSLCNGNMALMSLLESSNRPIKNLALIVGQNICIPSCYYSSYNIKSTETTHAATTRKITKFSSIHTTK